MLQKLIMMLYNITIIRKMRLGMIFDEYIEEKGYKSKSHNLAIRRWVIDAVKEQEAKKQRQQKNVNTGIPSGDNQTDLDGLF